MAGISELNSLLVAKMTAKYSNIQQRERRIQRVSKIITELQDMETEGKITSITVNGDSGQIVFTDQRSVLFFMRGIKDIVKQTDALTASIS